MERAAVVPDEVRALEARLEGLAAAAARREALGLARDAARTRHEAAIEHADLADRLVPLEDAHRDAREAVLDAREVVQDLAGRRLAGMAAELAGRLAEGVPCQVCGSADHPHPAAPAPDAVTEADQDRAEALLADRVRRLDEVDERVRDARGRLAVLTAATDGLDPDRARSRLDAVIAELADADRLAAEVPPAERRLAALRAEQDDLTRRRAAAEAAVTRLRDEVAAARAVLADVAEEVATAVAEAVGGVSAGHGALPDVLDDLGRTLDVLLVALRDVEALDRTTARVAELREQADATASAQGFADLAEARAATLPAGDRAPLERLLADRAATEARARAVLEELGSPALDGDPDAGPEDGASADLQDALFDADEVDDDPAGWAQRLADAESAASAADRDAHLLDERADALEALLVRLEPAVASWAPVRDDSLRAESMSRLVRGMGHDNQLQMRLSAYVLATRLDQVLDAANERLGTLRDQRYLLQRTGRATRKGAQAGLGLEVVDQWTGDVREPTTLSGGETFVVSLSLALGLADVVTQEAGGTEIETLFVDEGFGTLDADTLDDVMDRLDGLRAGGRTVGVVTHVSELRNRIPTQVHVEKHRSGSTVAVRTLVG